MYKKSLFFLLSIWAFNSAGVDRHVNRFRGRSSSLREKRHALFAKKAAAIITGFGILYYLGKKHDWIGKARGLLNNGRPTERVQGKDFRNNLVNQSMYSLYLTGRPGPGEPSFLKIYTPWNNSFNESKALQVKKLQELFENTGIVLRLRSNDPKKIFRAFLVQFARKFEGAPEEIARNFDELKKILIDAKSFLKTFLLKNSTELEKAIKEAYHDKWLADESRNLGKRGVNRLFTYAYVQSVIKSNNMVHVRLPQKTLAIYDRKVKKFLEYEEASRVIDTEIKFFLQDEMHLKCDYASDRYEFVIFATKEHDANVEPNQEAIKEMLHLLKKAPFDIGSGGTHHKNIFTDSRGDLIIIDTEFRGFDSDDPKNPENPINFFLTHYTKGSGEAIG